MNGSEEDDGKPSCALDVLLIQTCVAVMERVVRVAPAVHVV
jgi:hypothetical protein